MVAGCLDGPTNSQRATEVFALAGASRDKYIFSFFFFFNKALGLNTADTSKHFVKFFVMEN